MWYNLQAPGEGKMKGFGGKEWDGVLSSTNLPEVIMLASSLC